VQWHAGLATLRLAARFVVATVAGRLVGLTVALCAVLSFTELGIAGRYDASRSLTLGLEGRCGLTPDRHDALLGTSDSTTRCGVDASFRKIFGNGMWLGVTLSFQRDTDHISYANGASYETGSAPFFVGALDFGVPLWRRR